MSKKNQSGRLTVQQKENEGVIGIFGTEAKLHDSAVGEVSQVVTEWLKNSFPQLEFRHRKHITK